MPTKTEFSPTPKTLPADLAAVALIDAHTCAATGSMSVSWWLERVASGEAPQPAIRMPRCTRWRASDAADFWRNFAQRPDAAASEKLLAQARRASATALARRQAHAAKEAP